LKEEKEFDDRIISKNNKGNDKDVDYKVYRWFVVFYTNWAETCIYTRSIWDDYSRKYDCEALRFAEVNVGKLKCIAERYSINTSGVSRQ